MKRLFISIFLLMVATLIFSQEKSEINEINAQQEIVNQELIPSGVS